ncbi:Membrane fusion protein of RND family multidrug efflux pump [hydrothermal vent metagenome]|uniref:Membrane fusion protein of RND family multidrug efflux pump n=1 Tax=hydrothermal vent metagenome TaxID=652676 RepID=A0A3B0Y6A7_9ZZZZ
MKFSSKAKKETLAVFAVSIIGIVIAVALFIFKPVAEKQPVADVIALAEFVRVKKQSRPLTVLSQGSVNAKTHISLVAEVNGRVTHMAQLKSNGGFFKKGDLLLNIDDTDYLLTSVRARAQVAAAKQQLLKVEIEAGQAKYDLEQMGRNPSKSTAYALRKPHLAEAQANLQAAQADLKIAQLKMQRTRVKAPFDGRVVKKFVDIGQYVGIGTVLADIYSTDAAQVRLPLSLYQIELLGIALYDRPAQLQAVDVTLISEYFSSRHVWRAKLSHIEGVLDERNRLVFVVVEIKNPYERDPAYPDRSSLTPGMFIKAELKGEVKDGVVKLPRTSLRFANEVWVIDENERLLKKHIVLYTKDEHFIYIKSGLHQGERVIVNAIDYPIEGMKLSPMDTERTTVSPATSTLSGQSDTTQKTGHE